ncbi:MAG: tRNA pseudouridine(55) synthase TruB [Candidatus Gastranaerophilales bacterium]|nr:tRNA pseudouridine(55) synthase TruB [Candidatus Gastranaerophilales bacterium]
MAKSNLFGILNINKPKGITSFDVVARLRKILNIKKIGHTGTLDPLAQGVLPICVGDATRIIEYLPSGKSYRATARLGFETNTYDLEGEITRQTKVNVTKEQVAQALSGFFGEIEQTPPIFSAIKIKGKKLYEYARKNEEIEVPKRKVTVSKIELVDFIEEQNPYIVFDVDCSSGTYIRSIIHDLGQKLGCGAMMTDLTRTKANGFDLQKAQNLDTITLETANFIDPLESIEMPVLEIDEQILKKIQMGQFFSAESNYSGMVGLCYENKLIATAEQNGQKIAPKKVFVH